MAASLNVLLGERSLVEAALIRATRALELLSTEAETFLPVSLLRARAAAGLRADPLPLLRQWDDRSTSELGVVRYRWPSNPKYLEYFGHWSGPIESWLPWRPRDEATMADKRQAFIARFLTPVILADTVEWLGGVAAVDDEAGQLADRYLAEARTKIRRDVAGYAQEAHAWGDTWALWCLTRRPRALQLLHPFALAIAEAYADTTIRRGPPVRGTRFPFFETPLVSASAHLAAGLVALGIHPKLTGALAVWIRESQHADGGFGDADGPSDILTTLAAADLLSGLDPGWDPGATIAFVLAQQRPDGWWRAFGPETVWLTTEVRAWLSAAALPFASRFQWPEVPVASINRRTGVASYDYYADIARLFQELPGLANADVEVAFLDMAHFGAFNNRHGMAAGDSCLREFAQSLAQIPEAKAIRDGGDEFLVVGAPTEPGETNTGAHRLADRLDAFRHAWPETFRARFGDEPVPAARILVGRTRGGSLVAMRDQLGLRISALKSQYPDPPETGVLVRLTDDGPGVLAKP